MQKKIDKEHVNGKISYIPALSPNTLKSKLNKFFGDGEEI